MPELARKLLAEALGTFAIVLIGTLSITLGGNGAEASLGSIALAFGLIVAAMVAALVAVSGAHFNPAVTVAFTLLGRIAPAQSAAYIVTQVAAACLAAYLILGLCGLDGVAGGVCALTSGVNSWQGVALEALGTGLLLVVILGSACDPRAPQQLFPLTIGLSITAIICALGPLTGAALNPARALGPALASGDFSGQWVYWLGPVSGALAAAVVMRELVPALRVKSSLG